MKPALPILLGLALTACQGEKTAPQGGNAAGEILPGSTSDAMLPYDTVRSEPPLAPPPEASGKPGARAGDDAADDEVEPESSEAAGPATPAASATPAPTVSPPA